MLLRDFSVVTPYNARPSSCGYCKSSAGSRTYGMSAHLMTPKDYQALINRGWRRSGRYLYKPNLRDSCCPQYTIRLNANEFEASKHQRQIVNRFNTYIQEGDDSFEKDITLRKAERSEVEKQESSKDSIETSSTAATLIPTASTPISTPKEPGTSASTTPSKKQKQKKPPKNAPQDLRTRIRLSEYLHSPEVSSWKHRLKIILEPSSFTEEKYALYAKYQKEVHHESKSRCLPKGFTNFLVSTPLTPSKESNWTEEDPGFGSFHQCYYLDDKLIAVSVIDILPECVSAVYFFYDTDYSVLSLGKYSAQREIALAQTLNTKPGYENLKYYYMGFYIFTCPKMTYKGQFHPSYLLDPETYNWIEFKKCQQVLGEQRYTSFEHPTAMNPLFEAKVKTIIEKKKGSPSSDSSEDEDEVENDSDGTDADEWESVDEDGEDEYEDSGSDGINNKAPRDSNNESESGKGTGNERKKKRLSKLTTGIEAETESSIEKSASEATEKETAVAAKKQSREMKRVFRETIKQPPPGCLDPKDLTQYDLAGVLCLTNSNTLRPVLMTDMYRNHKDIQKTVAEYVSYVGIDLANAMILYIL
ncbi:arginine-tRNA-protein transferase [Lobosporangium transversale]|uniref:Arginyl-tRNA--protein transferase 1 n=1 Tax=Lobosporangium transversale TaxID=64571 RepID=A0A1Y2GK23_9FUNG|nr:arginine-tRNA-protein transferase [Lobosporangium transversale]ORZ12027.1 arginine-tRNA-protein transferase [Lobosporangium transversale]|eukprot:XP_021879892.1 arginine-tRNA-protein transferase [Lobosporangium transversale]